jgi:DNA-binding winged helix-turn-helix (wHTH) protein
MADKLLSGAELRFEGYEFDSESKWLRRPDGSTTRLRPQVAQLLRCFIANRGKTVSNRELADMLRPGGGRNVDDQSLHRIVSDLRFALASKRLLITGGLGGYKLHAESRSQNAPKTYAELLEERSKLLVEKYGQGLSAEQAERISALESELASHEAEALPNLVESRLDRVESLLDRAEQLIASPPKGAPLQKEPAVESPRDARPRRTAS